MRTSVPCCARPQRAAPQAIIKRKNFFIFSIFFIASVSHPPDCLHLLPRFKEEREAACRTACHNSGIPIPVKTQTAKQQPHAYGYTYPHPPTKQGMQARVYTWSVSICCITLRSHLEFGDFLLRQSNFQKDALFYSTIPTLRDLIQRYEIYLNTTKEKPELFLQASKKGNGELTFCHFVHRVHSRFPYSGVHRAANTNTRISRLMP